MKIDRNHLNLSHEWLMLGVAYQWHLAVVEAIEAHHEFCWFCPTKENSDATSSRGRTDNLTSIH